MPFLKDGTLLYFTFVSFKAIKQTMPPLAKKDEHIDFMESTRRKVQ